MSKLAKVRMADVLTRAGYNIERSLRACRYPFVESITFLQIITSEPPAPETMDVLVSNPTQDKDRTYTVRPPEKVQFKPTRAPVLTSLQHRERVEVLVKYKGSKIDSKYISFNSDKIPPVPGWPVPRVLKSAVS